MTEGQLIAKLAKYCAKHNLPKWSADELLHHFNDTVGHEDHVLWLEQFCEDWNNL